MNKKYFKENILIVTYGLIMFFLISNLKYVSHVIDNLIEIILPVIFGCVLAFFLNMPIKALFILNCSESLRPALHNCLDFSYM